MLCSFNDGNVDLINHKTHPLVNTFQVCDLPVRSAKFVSRENWFVTGSDDGRVKVFNYNNILALILSFEAHPNYAIICIAVHPTQPLILTSSDDKAIKLWNWEKSWLCQQVFDGHTGYVMQIVFNSKDRNRFVSATANFTLAGHESGVNCVDYYHRGNKSYLISGDDDGYIKIWDYQNQTCVHTLDGHTKNISAVLFHPQLPIVLAGSEDGTVRIWHAGTCRLETSLIRGIKRVCTIACMEGSNNVVIGYDNEIVMVEVSRKEPAFSLNKSNGDIIWAKDYEGISAIYPEKVQHNANGSLFVICGDGKYIIYTSLEFKAKFHGVAREFVWAANTGQYAVRESSKTVKVFNNFIEKMVFKCSFAADSNNIFGGYLLGIYSNSKLSFYDWKSLKLVRRFDIQPTHVYWAENASLVALATADRYFILKYHADAVQNAADHFEDIEDAFETIVEIEEVVKCGLWVDVCFVYTTTTNTLNYFIGEVVTVSDFDKPMYFLDYDQKDNGLYLFDKELSVVFYPLLLSVEYITAVSREDFDTAKKMQSTVPNEHQTIVAHYLEQLGFGLKHRFVLALVAEDLVTAHELTKEANSLHKWRQLSQVAIEKRNTSLLQECIQKTNGILENGATASDDPGKNNSLLFSILSSKILSFFNWGMKIPSAVNKKADQSLADPEECGNLILTVYK